MSAKTEGIIRSLRESLRRENEKKTSAYDTRATIRRIEDGVAWVHIPGGVDETPVTLTIGANVGDEVQVRVSGGRAFLVGNASAPPTDDKYARQVNYNLGKQIEQTNVVMRTINRAVQAVKKIADNTNQYFWHTEEGTDTGVHITEIPQEEFLADPEHGGGNLLARSNGVAVRDGLTELSKFTASGVYLGEDDAVVISPTGATKTVWEDESIGHFSFPATIDLSASAVYSILSDAQTFHLKFLVSGGTTDMNFTKGEAHTHEYVGAFDGEYDGESTITVTSHSALYTEGDFFIYAQIEKQGGVFSFGHRSVSDDAGFFSAAFGEGLLASGDEQAVFGRYNEDDQTKAVIIGNGTATGSSVNRSNALSVDWNGNILSGNTHKVPCVLPWTFENQTAAASTRGTLSNLSASGLPSSATVLAVCVTSTPNRHWIWASAYANSNNTIGINYVNEYNGAISGSFSVLIFYTL